MSNFYRDINNDIIEERENQAKVRPVKAKLKEMGKFGAVIDEILGR